MVSKFTSFKEEQLTMARSKARKRLMLLSLPKNGKTICTAFTKLHGRMELVDLTNGSITITPTTVCLKTVTKSISMQLLTTLRNSVTHTIGGVSQEAGTKFTLLTQLASLFNLMEKPLTHLPTAQATALPVNQMMDALDKEFATPKMP